MSKPPRRILFIGLFIAAGIILEILLWATNLNGFIVFFLSPALSVSHWLDQKFSFLTSTPLANELIFVLPVNIIYFGIIGYWIKRISEERGALKVFSLIAIVLLIIFIHWQASLSLRDLFPSIENLNLPEDPFR